MNILVSSSHDVPIETMDVEKHINERIERARQVVKNSQKETNVDIDLGGPTITSKPQNETLASSLANEASDKEEVIDLQKELEAKFDELFGTSTSNDVEE